MNEKPYEERSQTEELRHAMQEMLAEAATQSGRSPREQADEFVKTARPSSIIQRAADVDEVANLAVYLASPLSSARRSLPPLVK